MSALDRPDSAARRFASLCGRLYRGDTMVDFIGRRRQWYLASGVIVAICVLSIVFRGFSYGIEFRGGDQFLVPAKPGTTDSQLVQALAGKGIDAKVQVRGQGKDLKYVIRAGKITDEAQRTAARAAIAQTAHVDDRDIAATSVSSSWGGKITQQALISLVVFLVLVGAFIWIRFEQNMAIAALAALAHDLLLTAGVYSLVGFEVSPSTVVGLLTILGYSLYDTVVVFDKVHENTRGLLGSTRYTYAEAANLAVNQTLMRSVNTSLIGLLPVAGLLFVGAGLLGVGTLKDLALVLFVGMLTGAYSSLFLATPWLVELKLLDPRYRAHVQRVLAKRAAGGKGEPVTAAVPAGPIAPVDLAEGLDEDAAAPDLATSASPRAGTRPGQRKRPAGGGRPGAKRR